MDRARAAAEAAARTGYGRLVATLAARTRNIALAEEALAEAFATALRVWPERGVPASPEAWLLTAARRAAGHGGRHRAVQEAAAPTLAILEEEMQSRTSHAIPDDRLRLMFTCAHPAIAPEIRTPLMLQTVLGLDALRIGAAFAVPAATMGQRLVRAKAKIRDAGIPFETPERTALPARLHDVLQAIYAAFGTGWDQIGGADASGPDLASEAIYLARLVIDLLPAEPEPKGLLALMLYSEARRPARRDAAGAYVALRDQDRALWYAPAIIEAEALLTEAASLRRFGRFQTEAALQSLHVQAPRGAEPDARALVALYDVLASQTAGLGALVARAVAHARLHGPDRGLAILDDLPPERVAAYQPYWAARADLLRRAGNPAEAAARAQAIALTADPAVAAFLAR